MVFSGLRGSTNLKEGVWELRVHLGRDTTTVKRKQRSQTFGGPAQAADQALRYFVDQWAPSRSDGVGAMPFSQIKTTKSSREVTELDDLAHDPVQGLGDSLPATRRHGRAELVRRPARQPELSDPAAA